MKRINNPLTIIAIFAVLAEVNATIAISLINEDLHCIFIWFIIGFPTLLVILFFITLNFNTKVMYSPSDFKDDKNFMDSLFGNYYGNKKEDGDDLDVTKLSFEIEKKITEKLQQKLSKTIKKSNNPEIQKEIEELKRQIKNATGQTIVEVRSMFAIPTDLKEILLNFYRFPAFYMLIYAIIKSKATSIDKLKSFTKKYYLIGNWENGGMPELFRKGILKGTNTKFQVASEYKEHLENWIEQNNNRLNAMNNAFRKKEDCDNKNENTKFKERVEILNSRLKF